MIDAKDRIVEALYRVVQTVQNVGDLPLLLKMIMEESKHLLGAEASSLFLYDPEKNDLYFEVVVGEKDDGRTQTRQTGRDQHHVQ